MMWLTLILLTMIDIEADLHAGITAAKHGDHAQAKTQLMRVLEADERNEHAWYWLSKAVDTLEDKQVCFENVLALTQLFGAQMIYDVLTVEQLVWSEMLPRLILPMVIAVVSGICALGILVRQARAFYTSLVMCCLLLFFFAVSFSAVGLGLFSVAPDFERVFQQETAVLDTRLSEASSFYQRGRQYTKEGKWASAVVHLQRATALASQNTLYQRYLGWSYAQLGFYERSLDVLESALWRTAVPDKQQKIKRLIKQINKMAQKDE